jgi:hypothetical protein
MSESAAAADREEVRGSRRHPLQVDLGNSSSSRRPAAVPPRLRKLQRTFCPPLSRTSPKATVGPPWSSPPDTTTRRARPRSRLARRGLGDHRPEREEEADPLAPPSLRDAPGGGGPGLCWSEGEEGPAWRDMAAASIRCCFSSGGAMMAEGGGARQRWGRRGAGEGRSGCAGQFSNRRGGDPARGDTARQRGERGAHDGEIVGRLRVNPNPWLVRWAEFGRRNKNPSAQRVAH